MNRPPVKLEFISVKPEIIEEYIDEATKDKTMKVRMKWQQADIINRNQRRYRKELLQREIDRLQEGLVKGEVYGASYHPKGGDADLDDVSHIWNKAWMDGDGSCMGEATILPTDRGKNAMTLIKHGGRIGLSSRGFGTLTKKTELVNGKKTSFEDVNRDFKLVSFGDFVLRPSVPDAHIRGLIEQQANNSVAYDEDKNSEENIMNFKEKMDALKSEHEEDYNSFVGTLEKGVLEGDKFTSAVNTAVEAKKAEWKTEIATELQTKIDAIEKTQNDMVDGIREAMNKLSEIPGVIPEQKPNADADNQDGNVQDEDLKQTIADLEKRTKELEDDIKKRDADADAQKAKEELQVELKTKLNEELEKDEYKKYATLIEGELIHDDEIGIESVEALPEAVKTALERVSTIITEAEKAKIIESGIKPKGEIKNPDDKPNDEELEKRNKALWENARNSGSTLSYKEYVEKVINQN